jgi:hypothetical protein
MKRISAIIILCLTISVPALAEKVYTNSSLKKYDIYKSRTQETNNNTEQADPATNTDKKNDEQDKITILEQKMNWTSTSEDGNLRNYDWQVKITSSFAVDKQVEIEFNLLNQEGSILKSTRKTGSIEASTTYTFNGTGTVKSKLSMKVVRTSVKLTVK